MRTPLTPLVCLRHWLANITGCGTQNVQKLARRGTVPAPSEAIRSNLSRFERVAARRPINIADRQQRTRLRRRRMIAETNEMKKLFDNGNAVIGEPFILSSANSVPSCCQQMPNPCSQHIN